MLAPDGSVFHLRMHPQSVAEHVILVGDPARVARVGEHLVDVQPLAANREFTSLSGKYRNTLFTVVSTGIGCGCVDIVLNELDALVNVDLALRVRNENLKSLKIVRIGTSGSLSDEIANGQAIITEYSIGMDALAWYYSALERFVHQPINQAFIQHLNLTAPLPTPYTIPSDSQLVSILKPLGHSGITLSLPGFYAPQGRMLRLSPTMQNLVERAGRFHHSGLSLLNMEMESGALNALASMLGHQAITVCLAIDNRKKDSTRTDYSNDMDTLIEKTLQRLTQQ